MSIHASIRALTLGIRRAATSQRDSDVILFAGTGNPSGASVHGQSLATGQAALYARENATVRDDLLWWTTDAGTTWARLQAPLTIADPGNGAAIPVTAAGACMMTVNGSETRTLAIPSYVGQRLVLIDAVHTSGSIAITSAQSINQAGNTVMTFGAVADFIELVAVTIGGALRWRVVVNDGVALS